ncbi:MAG: bifunctional UDP-3-O-[3-hydroxymyristoyl] N-acetylglucosamine deacetylase/3-hydroxyacyl-ACP dehydratase [Schleiferiaceae bacterium]|jgi:UDP-3-O-[3-hydroxymyristoyl] N-acetylglucosamine deacetylase/3-hydroxyacyl-[acyl-carrier-protein] dehydratase|nr:bifunctional UDP-3-O-[3-hydroxymyristoyl] N-acetylglucosamine deacetylase/3-hydroxyacyl-ACP dehydratase [Schleiferiaceae bacterium]
MTTQQHTLQQAVSISGTGLHTGKQVTLTFQPAEPQSGYVLVRTDLEQRPEIPALASYVSSTDRGTTLAHGEVSVSTVEHVLAALTGLQIDNCRLEIDGPEMPIMDGSSLPFVEVLEQAGLKAQDQPRDYFEITEPFAYRDEAENIEILALPADHYQVTAMVDYETKVLGSQHASLQRIDDFKDQIANSRTFSFLHELEYLLDHGLIQGGDLKNAIVYVDQEVEGPTLEKLKKAFGKEDVSVKANGILDNLDLHHPNEAARHKLLDVIGDLALAGAPIKGRIIATRPGHAANAAFAKLLQKKIKEARRTPAVPSYDPATTPVYDVNKIMNILPHRPPFLLVDKILELSTEHVVGVKSITMNEPYFTGHFPGAPVMPGVLQIEAMAQAGGILALNTVPDPENYLTYFLKIDGVRFKRQVVPGDVLLLSLKLTQPIRRGIVQMDGQAYVGRQLACEASMMAQIVKEKNKA